jgi:CubicO group peptidase (beta-lactamase class C family)
MLRFDDECGKGFYVNKAARIALAFLLVATSARADAHAIKSAKSSSESRIAAGSEIGNFMGELYRRGQFNGSVLVADRDGIIYRSAFGLANRSSNVAFTPDTPSCLASLSKPLTALAVMMLAEKTSIRYDDPISKYVSGLPPSLGVATVRQLLTHTSGIPDYSNLNVEHPGMSNAEVLKALEHVDSLSFPAGQKYSYSNSGYVLLSILVERVSGTPLPEYLQRNIFQPLRMTRTFVLTDDKQKTPDVARAYSAFGAPDDYLAFVTGDGGVYSTVDDLYLFDRALYTDELIRQSTLTQAFTPAVVREGTTTYGFGWNIKEDNSGKRVWHTGNTSGFRAFIERRLAERSVVIMLTNVGNSKRGEINEAIHAILEGRSFTYPKKSSALALHEVIKTSGLEEGLKRYRDYKERSTDEYDLSESELNTLGYQLLYGDKRPQDANQIFLVNSLEHPSSSNAFDSLAEAYQVSGQEGLAKANYKKAIELDASNVHAKTMLAQTGSTTFTVLGGLLGGILILLLLYLIARRFSGFNA